MRYASARLFLTACLLGMALTTAMPSAAQAQVYGEPASFSPMGQKPLMIIRFNQRTVMYERPLYVAVSRALETKSSAVFDVVSYAPQDDRGTAERNLGRVMGTLREMGVPGNRLNVVRQVNAPVDTSEVHIFVR